MRITIFISFLVFFLSCSGDKVYTPKPRMYPKVEFPSGNYQTFETDYCDMTFSFPSYVNIEQEKNFFEEDPLHPCWFDLKFSSLNGKLHCSYYPVDGAKGFDKLVQDAFTFVDKHDIKANYRQETSIENVHGASGMIFEIDGPVATPLQFFLTDSTDHFFRGSLYFNNKVNPDSMKVVHDFVKNEVVKILESLEFQG